MNYVVISNEIKEKLTPSECYLYMILHTFKVKNKDKSVIKISTIAKRAGYSEQVTKNMLSRMYDKINIERTRTKFNSGIKAGYNGYCEWNLSAPKSNFTMIETEVITSKDLTPTDKHFYFMFKSILHNKHNDINIRIGKLSKCLNLSLNTVKARLSALLNSGFLSNISKNNYVFNLVKICNKKSKSEEEFELNEKKDKSKNDNNILRQINILSRKIEFLSKVKNNCLNRISEPNLLKELKDQYDNKIDSDVKDSFNLCIKIDNI